MAPKTDYYGNIFDDDGNYVSTDYFSSEQFANAKAANDALQLAYQGARDAEAANDGTPAKVAAFDAANARTSAALTGFTGTTSRVVDTQHRDAVASIPYEPPSERSNVIGNGGGGPVPVQTEPGLAPLAILAALYWFL